MSSNKQVALLPTGHLHRSLGIVALTMLSFFYHSADVVAAPDSTRHTSYSRIDNDILAGRDQGYSNGAEFGLVSPTVDNFRDPRLSAVERWLNRRFTWLQPKGFDENNLVLSLSHQIFTPEDRYRSDVIENDRPYAGVLLMGLGYNSRDSHRMQSTTLHIGLVGPSAQGEAVQDFAHGIVGTHRFSGWDNQLRDEPVFRVLHQRYRRYASSQLLGSSWTGDAIVHQGASLGTLATFANAGVELRFGPTLPTNFGSAPSLPTGETVTPSRSSMYTETLQVHAFLAVDVKYLLHDVTLDGNTWKDSPSVERRPLVADVGIGVAAHWRGWKIALARYFRSREFDGQGEAPQLGSLTLRREF